MVIKDEINLILVVIFRSQGYVGELNEGIYYRNINLNGVGNGNGNDCKVYFLVNSGEKIKIKMLFIRDVINDYMNNVIIRSFMVFQVINVNDNKELINFIDNNYY